MEKVMTVLGQQVTVYDRLPYRKKIEAAEEWAALAAVPDEESGIVCASHMQYAITQYIILKFFTGTDVSAYETYDGLCQMMDDLDRCYSSDYSANGNEDWHDFIREEEISEVRSLEDAIFDTLKQTFEARHSLAANIKKSFGFLFDGRDLTETLAQARDVNEQMIDHLGAIAKADKQPIDITQYAKKKK